MLWLLSHLTNAGISNFECAHILLQYNLMLWNAILCSAMQIAYYRAGQSNWAQHIALVSARVGAGAKSQCTVTYIAQHSIALKCKMWTGALLKCTVMYWNLGRCSPDLGGKGTDWVRATGQTQQTDDSRKSDWLRTGKYFSPVSGKYSTIERQILCCPLILCVLQIYTYDRPTNIVSWQIFGKVSWNHEMSNRKIMNG